MNKRAKIFYKDRLAGILEQLNDEYIFTYDSDYLNNESSVPISFTIPLQKESYKSKVLFPFFDGLIPEGWLLDITVKNWKLNRYDRMSILLSVCRDTIGAVSVVEDVESEHV
jgi:serine/threonine-protein kinase HipA